MDWSRGITIGQGSSATVSIATCRRSGHIFAVKSVELSQSELLQREQKFLSTLSNPYVVSYMGYDITREHNKLMYNLMMEYAPAGTLTDAIRKQGGRLEESMIGYYTHQIVQGLEYLHSSVIVHCDIKGRNILLGENGAKISDFGCAKWINPENFATMPIGGTPMFMAPEVARGEEQGFAADIWALGCTIIEMASGGSPWPNVNDPVSILYKIAYSGELPNFPENLSFQGKDFLSKCLQINPNERWTAKQLAKHPFIEEFNSNSGSKQVQEFDTNSPTSILDEGVWNSIEESGDFVQTRSLNSPVQRIGRLSLNSKLPNWTWEESWITIRGNKDEKKGKGICGSVTVGGDDMVELESSCSTASGEQEELILNYLGNNFCCRNRSSEILMGCTCTKYNRAVMGSTSLNFERCKEMLVFNQTQLF